MNLPPFEQVVDRYGIDVWRFTVSQVGWARADDVFQETMLAALGAYPSLRDPSVTKSWLLRIAARKAIDGFRARARAPVPVSDPDPGAATSTADPDGPDEELWERVRALPLKQREAVGLRFVLDWTYADIGAAMETSPEAARRNVFEGLGKLRAQVRNDDDAGN